MTQPQRLPLAVAAVLGLAFVGMSAVGCARPNEFGYTPAYTSQERGAQILRNWDIEGKMLVDDVDHALLLRPHSDLTDWHIRE